ncbi:hypothetical protein ACFYKX_18100 [Cytobacillus sp. FJAT-54145]|uniref:Uncharacterized protein n=1 Tax=Cytobacillus spartinae TaxID=3299023 RepID=A0ABW6KI32_9BACI
MVNENHDKFLKEQRTLKNKYLGDEKDNHPDRNLDPEYNTRGNTNMSVGAAGRDIEKQD